MYIRYYDIELHVEGLINDPSFSKSIFLLHGFSGSGRDWSSIVPKIDKRYNVYTVDLVGHGKSSISDDPFSYTADSLADQLSHIIASINSPDNVLLGYSMGGRVALTYAALFRSSLKGLILESASAGIKEPELRKERKRKDKTLAAFIKEKDIESFVDYWMNLSLFNTQKRLPAEKLQQIKQRKLENNKMALIYSLREFGTGKMPPLFNKLKRVEAKTLLLTGELDTKFTKLNAEMEGSFPSARHEIIKNAGHNTHLEEPEQFISAVNRFLKEI